MHLRYAINAYEMIIYYQIEIDILIILKKLSSLEYQTVSYMNIESICPHYGFSSKL